VGDVFPYVLLAAATVLAGFVIAQTAMFATTVYLHRFLAHRSIELRPEVQVVSRTIIWMTTALKPRQWAQVHRFHHATEDTADDPHTPRNFGGGRAGAWQVVWRNAPLYTRCTRDPRLANKYRDLRADRFDAWFFDHGQLGLAVGIGTACALMATLGHWMIGGWVGVGVGAACGLVASGLHASYYVLAGGAINGFGHAGSVDRPVGGYAMNRPILAWLTVGEGWHRNHHTAENSPRFGQARQVDLGWLLIRALRRIGLADLTTRGRAGLQRLQTSTLQSTPLRTPHRG